MRDARQIMCELASSGLSPDQLALVMELSAAVASESRPEQTRSPGAIRTERYRINKASQAVTERHTVTDGDDCDASAPLDKKSPQTPIKTNPQTPPIVPPKRNRGSRLPATFEMPDDWRRWASTEKGWNAADLQAEAESFRDYWVAKPGAAAVKLDWEATWRNWVRSSHRSPGKTAATAWESPC